jgi:hypothetical protein
MQSGRNSKEGYGAKRAILLMMMLDLSIYLFGSSLTELSETQSIRISPNGRMINPLKPVVTICTTCFKTKTLHYAHKVYLCVPYGSHNKQRLFPQTALTGWAL